MPEDIAKLEKELAWYKAYADHIQSTNPREHNCACEVADDITDDTEYPYSEGDDYWTLQEPAELEYEDNSGFFQNGIVAIQSCWDDQSKDFHREDSERLYFNSLEEVLKHSSYRYEFIKVECFDSAYEDIDDGDYFVAVEETGKFQKSY